jgi:hypothetical protein
LDWLHLEYEFLLKDIIKGKTKGGIEMTGGKEYVSSYWMTLKK